LKASKRTNTDGTLVDVIVDGRDLSRHVVIFVVEGEKGKVFYGEEEERNETVALSRIFSKK
jgi:hypothetical protein